MLLGVVTPLRAQTENVPKRPALPATADTNDADAYYQVGFTMVYADPRLAADAFYWATRLNPYGAHAFYGRYTALLISDPGRLRRYVDGHRKTARSPEMRSIDSLRVRALMLDPFLHRRFEHVIMLRYFEHVTSRLATGSRAWQVAVAGVAFRNWVRRAGPETEAWAAYCEGRFADALNGYAEALRKRKGVDTAFLRAERGRTFYLAGRLDSALVELGLALEALRKADREDLVVAYDSKAVLEHSIATVHEALGDRDAAREAYARALAEDLAYYPAHVKLAVLALQDGDTTTGLTELDLAVQIKGNEPMLRLFYGYLLSQVKRYAEAEAQFAKAVELEPFYARPYQLLGAVYEAQGKRAEAMAQYEAYLARAPLRDAPRDEIARRLEALRSGTGGPGS